MLGSEGLARETDYLPTDPPAMRKLKSELLCVESAIPEQAMMDAAAWDRAAWISAVQSSTSIAELRRLLGDLEASLKGEWLSKEYVRQPVLVKGTYLPIGKEVAVGPTATAHAENLRATDAVAGALRCFLFYPGHQLCPPKQCLFVKFEFFYLQDRNTPKQHFILFENKTTGALRLLDPVNSD